MTIFCYVNILLPCDRLFRSLGGHLGHTGGINLGQNAAETPPRFVVENAGLSMAARSSWLSGAACAAFAFGSTVALMMSMRKRLIAS